MFLHVGYIDFTSVYSFYSHALKHVEYLLVNGLVGLYFIVLKTFVDIPVTLFSNFWIKHHPM